jgi:uncharacterized protein YneF (UPF0154 family)
MNKIKSIIWIILGAIVIGFFIYKVARRYVTDHILENNSQQIRAVIINERNYMGNQPVKPKFSYSYQFVINRQKYTGNAHDTTIKVGDTVEVEYNKANPSINRPLNPKE